MQKAKADHQTADFCWSEFFSVLKGLSLPRKHTGSHENLFLCVKMMEKCGGVYIPIRLNVILKLKNLD